MRKISRISNPQDLDIPLQSIKITRKKSKNYADFPDHQTQETLTWISSDENLFQKEELDYRINLDRIRQNKLADHTELPASFYSSNSTLKKSVSLQGSPISKKDLSGSELTAAFESDNIRKISRNSPQIKLNKQLSKSKSSSSSQSFGVIQANYVKQEKDITTNQDTCITENVINQIGNISPATEIEIDSSSSSESNTSILEENQASGATSTTKSSSTNIYENSNISLLAEMSAIKFDTLWNKNKVNLLSFYETGIVNEVTAHDILVKQINPRTDANFISSIQKYVGFATPPISGIYLEKSQSILTLIEARKMSILDSTTTATLLEYQAANGYIINPNTGRNYHIKTAAKFSLIEKNMVPILKKCSQTAFGFVDKNSSFSSASISSSLTSRHSTYQFNPYSVQVKFGSFDFEAASQQVKKIPSVRREKLGLAEAVNQGYLLEQQALKCLDAQLCLGGIIDVNRGHRVPLNYAMDENLVDSNQLQAHANPENLKFFTNPKTQQKQTYAEMLNSCMYHKDLQVNLLPFYQFEETHLTKYHNPIGGILNLETNQEMSIFAAEQQGLITSSFAVELLTAQAACGKMIDFDSAGIVPFASFTVESKLLESENIQLAHQAFTGYSDTSKSKFFVSRQPSTIATKFSLLEHLDNRKISEKSAIKFLNAQLATGGIIDRRCSFKLNLRQAVDNKFMGEDLADRLENLTENRDLGSSVDDSYGPENLPYFDDDTGENCSYSDLLAKSIINDKGLVLFPIHGVTKKVQSIDRQSKIENIQEFQRNSRVSEGRISLTGSERPRMTNRISKSLDLFERKSRTSEVWGGRAKNPKPDFVRGQKVTRFQLLI